MPKRISFSQTDAAHVYEWLEMYWRGHKNFGGCFRCRTLGKRLEAVIGANAARSVKRLVKKNPGK